MPNSTRSSSDDSSSNDKPDIFQALQSPTHIVYPSGKKQPIIDKLIEQDSDIVQKINRDISHTSHLGASVTSLESDTCSWIVQKFGGTSVGKFLDAITRDIVPTHLKDHRLVVVCSARSGETKSKGTTSLLIRAASDALIKGSTKFHKIVDEISDTHIQAAKDTIKDPDILERLIKELEEEIHQLRKFLEAAQIIDEISPRSKDVIIGSGEKLACRIVAAALEDNGVPAQYVSFDKVVLPQENMINSSLDQEFYDNLAINMGDTLHECDPNKVPVVTGFFGPVPGSLLQNVGRGYTDLCAALIAVALQAEELQVWKEVDGIFTADPRKVPTARLLPIITPDEAAELTYYGSEVIHPFTMEQVIRARIPIRIKNVMNPKGVGTVVFPDIISKNGVSTPPHPPKVLFENGYHLDLSRRHPTAVTIKDRIIVLNVHSNRKTISHGFFAKIFLTLDKHGIPVDLISTSEVHISMALHADLSSKDLERAISELKQFGTVDISKDMAILSLVGKQMKNMVGIASKMFNTLASADINIEMISQGASEINISCVIQEKDSTKALNSIHQRLLTPVISTGSPIAFSGPWFY